MTARYWDDSCDRCRELEALLEQHAALADRLEDELDTYTIQLTVCRAELAEANYRAARERERAEDATERLNNALEAMDRG